VELVKEGFDVTGIDDPVYFAPSSGEGYQELTPGEFANIVAG